MLARAAERNPTNHHRQNAYAHARAKALEAAAGQFIDTGERDQARGAFTHTVEVYTFLGATADVARRQGHIPRPRHRGRPAAGRT